MKINIVLVIASVAGIQLRVVARLKELGLECVNRKLKDTPFGESKYLLIQLEGPEVDKQQVIDALRAVPGIMSIDKYEVASTAPPQPVEAAASAAAPTDEDVEEGEAELHDRMLVFSLLSRYPKLAGRLYEIKSEMPEAGRGEHIRSMGVEFGVHLAKQFTIKATDDLEHVLNNLVMPAISPMTKSYIDGNTIDVSSSKINLKVDKPEPDSCQFLLGTMQGLLKTVEALPSKVVRETECVCHGGNSCKFVFG